MHRYASLFYLTPLVCLVAHAQESPPVEAQKYHEALLKHPHNPTVFSRFYDAWLDAKSIESLEAFLKNRAETHGENDYIILARYQLQRGQDPLALAPLNKAIESLTNDPALLLERANLLIRINDFATARRDLEAVAQLGNETLSIEASKIIGKSYLREGNPDAAIQTWEKIITNHPKNEELLEDLVELASSAEQPEQALKYSDKLIAASSDPYKKTLRIIRRGELLAKSGESDKAIALWSETLSQTGEGSWLEREIFAHIEQCYRRLDRLDLLTAKLEELAKAHPRRLLIHRELAKLEATSGNIDSAIGRFREVLRRSPGESELREEFIRLLITSERFDDASAEIGKMLSSTPQNPELHLRLAELTFQKSQLSPDLDKKITSTDILKSLETALIYLDPTEVSGLRIAILMIRYELADHGENLLKKLSTQPNASSAPAEALASEYTRTKRTAKALEILTDLTKSPDAETVLRATNNMAPLTKAEIPFNILLSRLPDFPNNNPYIGALIQASLSAKKPADAIPSALKLVRSSKLASEIQESTKLASTVIHAAEKSPDLINELSNNNQRSIPETCLLAALLEIQKDYEKSDVILKDSSDPILLRFYASLLSVRGDFPAAIATLNRLSQTSTDNSASYFKELSDLQLRAGDSASSLKTIEQWKIAAPTDKTPWTIAIRLLRESGRYPEAIETTRRALTRFSSDEDLTAGLADLYQQTGAYPESERIYWKLYDQAPDPNAQSRWAARLSTLAHNRGNTEELKEKFLQRSRSNNQSIGPILALVELTRVTRDQQAQLEHLYQALRIKPTDIEIRLQIAATEKQIGNLEKQLSILNEGIDQDSSGRIRTSLAQAYIDQGQIMKGMHMLRTLNGERASDPRFIESSASSIANAGMIAEAIQYLEESLPQNSDWRSRFLLADLLQKDGRETEGTSILLTLMNEKNEIPGLTPNSNFQHIQHNNQSQEYYFQNLISIVSQEIYNTRHSNRSYSRQPLILPASLLELRFRSKILLAFMANLGSPAISEKIAAANINELNLISDIIACHSDNGIDYLALLEKHPSHQDLIKMIIQQGRLRDPNTGDYYSSQKVAPIYQKLLESPNLDKDFRTQIIINQLQSDPKNEEAWNQVFALLEKSTGDDNDNQYSQIEYALQYLVIQQKTNIPSKHFPKIRDILLNKGRGDSYQEMNIYAMLGEMDPWIKSVNKLTVDHQKQIEQQLKTDNQEINETTLASSISQFGFYPQVPQIRNLPLTSIPVSYYRNINTDHFNSYEYGSQGTFSAKDFLKHIDRFESPLIRAWIAILAADQKAIQKTLSVKPSKIEANDFEILKIWLDIEAKRYPEACRSLLKLSNTPTFNPNHIHWAKTSFLSIVAEIPAEKRGEFIPNAREIIDTYTPPTNARQPSRHDGITPALLQIANKLGFDDLVVKFSPHIKPLQPQLTHRRNPIKPALGNPASIVSSRPNSNPSRQRPITPVERIQKLSSENKHSAAAHEFLNHVQTQKKQGYDLSYIISNLKITDEVRKEIISITRPGNNPSLSKRLDFAEICLAFKETDTALTLLRELSAERPFDANICLQLAVNLPEAEIDTAAKLLAQCADSPAFYFVINAHQNRIHQARSNPATFHYFSLITKFLEISDPAKFQYPASNEINGHIYYFVSGNNLINLPSLISSKSSPQEDSLEALKHREIAQSLTTAMLRHPLLAESGFQYKRAAKWIEDPEKIDELARNIMLLEIQITSRNRHNSRNLPDFSSANWICDRLKQSKSLNDTFPPDFLASIEKSDPILATLLKSYFTIKTTKDIATFWDSGAMQDDGYVTARSTIQKAIMEKIAALPGSTDFFISRIKTFSQEQILRSRSNHTGEFNHIAFIHAALASCKGQNESTVNRLCKTIINAIYGENFDFSITNSDTNSPRYQLFSYANSLFDSILSRQTLDPITSIRVFQSIDSHRVPLQNYYWIQNIFQKADFTDPNKTIEFLDSLGFFKDTATWQPIAYSAISNHYEQITGTSTFSVTRNFINETIIQSLNYRVRTPEFVTLLEQRKPQTFGSLVTAALLSSDQANRERLMLAAFKHASPQLAKASEKQVEDFSLLIDYLPPGSIGFLPAKLQIKSKERSAQFVASILKSIDQQFKQIDSNPSYEPFGMIDSYIQQLAPYDLEKATETFLRAHSIYKANIAHYQQHQINTHQTYFNNILRFLSSDRKSNPASAIKFYRIVLDSTAGSEFGYTSSNQSTSHLYNLGYYLFSRLNTTLPKNTHPSLQPWLIANQLPEEYQNDALAAMICYTVNQQNSNLTIANLTPIVEKADGLSQKTRDIIISCAHITNLGNLTPESRTSSSQHLSKLINDPDFSPNTRTQIALSALRSREILTLPGAAEIYSEIFTNLSKQDQSLVNSLVIQSLAAASNTELPAESIPHLRKISEAFWDNANSPKSGGHPTIREDDALGLFLLAIHCGDHKNASILLPKIQPFAVGNLNAITRLILNGEFKLADQLLPDDSTGFFSRKSIYHSLPLLEKLSEYASKSQKPEQLLRLECQLLRFASHSSSSKDLETKIGERKHQLITLVIKNPPKSPKTRCEILSTIHSPSEPANPELQKLILETAAALDPQQTILDWFKKYRETTTNGLTEEAPYKILCIAAGLNLLNGDPKLFNQTCQSLTKISNETAESESYILRPFFLPLIAPAYIATINAIIEKKTDYFPEVLPVLEKLIIEISKPSSPSTEDLLNYIALYDFISHWENQPEKSSELIKNLQLKSNQSLLSAFSSPRKSFLFFDRYRSINQSQNLPRMGDKPIEFVSAILSHESIANIYVISNSWLTNVDSGKVYQEVMDMGKNPPESTSPSGKAYLKYHSVTRDIHVLEERVAAYQTLLKEIPNSSAWSEISINCKLQLIQNMARLPTPATHEMRAVFDSIDPKNISPSSKDYYERISKELIKAETKPE